MMMQFLTFVMLVQYFSSSYLQIRVYSHVSIYGKESTHDQVHESWQVTSIG